MTIGEKCYSVSEDGYFEEDPEQAAYDAIHGDGFERVTVYEGVTYIDKDEFYMEQVREEFGHSALAVKDVREYGVFVRDGDWVKQLEGE